MRAIERERRNAPFPAPTAVLVRDLRTLPATARESVLRRLAR
ncbi:hypothetical protein AB0C02_29485 [Micromonospora sp. NPDC048999]